MPGLGKTSGVFAFCLSTTEPPASPSKKYKKGERFLFQVRLGSVKDNKAILVNSGSIEPDRVRAIQQGLKVWIPLLSIKFNIKISG